MAQSVKYSSQKPTDLGSILHIRKTGMVMGGGVGVKVGECSQPSSVSESQAWERPWLRTSR